MPPEKERATATLNSLRSRGHIYQLPQIESNLFKNSFLTDLFFIMFRLVFLSLLQFVQCLCIFFLFYITVLIACMICFYYNVCDCHAFIKGNLLTYLLTCTENLVQIGHVVLEICICHIDKQTDKLTLKQTRSSQHFTPFQAGGQIIIYCNTQTQIQA